MSLNNFLKNWFEDIFGAFLFGDRIFCVCRKVTNMGDLYVQVVPQVENESKGVAPYNGDFDKGAEN